MTRGRRKGEDERSVEKSAQADCRLLKNRCLSLSVHFYIILPATLDPTRPQIKVMMGALEPLGMPLATDVLSGERADDGLYIPIIKRIEAGLSSGRLLFVGDCKMSALATRAYMAERQHAYLAPLPLTGGTAEAMAQWIDEGVAQEREGALTPINQWC